jgi:hypothetical protein
MRIRETIDNPSTASTESPPEDVIALVDSAGVALGSWPGSGALAGIGSSQGRRFQEPPTSRPPRSPCSPRRFFRTLSGLLCSGGLRARSISKRRRRASACKYHSPPAFMRDREQEVFR